MKFQQKYHYTQIEYGGLSQLVNCDMKGFTMNIEIYINNKPMESYSEEELEEIKYKLTVNAMAAIGFVPLSEADWLTEEEKQEYRNENKQ